MQEPRKYETIPYHVRKHCMVCGQASPSPLLEWPDLPLTEIYVDSPPEELLGFCDQNFCLCEVCGHGQITNVIDPGLLYDSSYSTRSSTSSSARGAIEQFLAFVERFLPGRDLGAVLDIGCNDTHMLGLLKDRARQLIGVDPILAGREDEFAEAGIQVVGDFSENVDFKAVCDSIDVVLCSHALEHIDDPASIVQRLLESGNDDTLYFFQFPGLESLVRDARFDQIFHQHYNYFSLQSVTHLLDSLGAELLGHNVNDYHWGSLMVAFRRGSGGKAASTIPMTSARNVTAQYDVFTEGMSSVRGRLEGLSAEKVYGYGAALMLPILDYHLQGSLRSLECVIDEDPGKRDRYYINMPIPIRDPESVGSLEDRIVLLTALSSLDAGRKIIPKLFAQGVKQLIVPLNAI